MVMILVMVEEERMKMVATDSHDHGVIITAVIQMVAIMMVQ